MLNKIDTMALIHRSIRTGLHKNKWKVMESLLGQDPSFWDPWKRGVQRPVQEEIRRSQT